MKRQTVFCLHQSERERDRERVCLVTDTPTWPDTFQSSSVVIHNCNNSKVLISSRDCWEDYGKGSSGTNTSQIECSRMLQSNIREQRTKTEKKRKEKNILKINNRNAKRFLCNFFFKLSFILTKCSCKQVIVVQYIKLWTKETDATFSQSLDPYGRS